uniref:Uncharacterized protein n=1 Tax=Moniliophthora roreri TaxID=221103 RepID=A0A0W0FQ02_MONRR
MENEAVGSLIVIPSDDQPQSDAVSDNGEAEKQNQQGHSDDDNRLSLPNSSNIDVDLNNSTQDNTVAVLDEEHEYIQGHDPSETKRVKVYELIGSRWIDHGTAFCYGHFSNDAADGSCEALLTARSERDYEHVILTTTIRSTDVYQRQQDTLIVWTEPDGVDYALSFQDKEGCAEVWNFIVDVQRHMNGNDDNGSITIGSSSPIVGPEPSSSSTTANIIRTGHLPAPNMVNIGEIERAIKGLSRTQQVKERLCEYIQSEDYLKGVIEVFHTAEETESLDCLHALCSLIQTILTLNDHSMYEHILEDDLFSDVVGMLEYDPEFPHHKANYRDFLHQSSQYHQPIPITDPSIQRKIHHTYRLQFLKDVVLARVLDDSTFNVLNSCIIFNQIDIISHVQQDQTFLREIVRLYVDEDMLGGGIKKNQAQAQAQAQTLAKEPVTISLNGNNETSSSGSSSTTQNSPKPTNGVLPNDKAPSPSDASLSTSSASTSSHKPGAYGYAPPEELSEAEIAHRREVILLIHHLCVMGKNVQLPARMALFRSLVDRGILFAVQWALSLSEKDSVSRPMISAGGEILGALLDHDLNGVRGHVLKQVVAIEKERTAGKRGADKAETIVKMSLVGDALKVWLDVPLNGEIGPGGGVEAGITRLNVRKDDPGTERFMEYFYKDCVETLFSPLHKLPKWKDHIEPTLQLTREETNRYVLLCELLYNFTNQHQFRSHFYILSTAVVTKIATLFKSRDKHLRHAAFRFFRLLLKQNNPNMHTQVMKYDILKPILDLTIRESRRDNLLSCSCQEYFEHIRRENMKDMIKHCMTKHEEEIKTLAESPLGGQRFQLFIRRWEMNNEPPPPPEELKQEKYMTFLCTTCGKLKKSSHRLDARPWPTQNRIIEDEDEDYFNADDDDEDDNFIPSISQQWSRGSGASSPTLGMSFGLKRKRRMGVAGPLSNKNVRPQNPTPPRSPQLSSLVDYDDEDDSPSNVTSAGEEDAASSSSLPPSPKLTHRQLSPNASGLPSSRAEDDEEDNMLEALINRGRPQSPAPGLMASMNSLGPMRLGEKRRRSDEDEDEELLERLSKSKKPDLGKQKENASADNAQSKTTDEPPQKKFKLKIGTTKSLEPLPGSSGPGAKDGDTG